MARNLTNSEAWAQAAREVRARLADGEIGSLADNAGLEDLPENDDAFWDAVEARAVELGGKPAGPA